jgi:hypothetical protein
VTRIVRYASGTGEVVEIVEVTDPHKAAEYKVSTNDELRPKPGCRFKGKTAIRASGRRNAFIHPSAWKSNPPKLARGFRGGHHVPCAGQTRRTRSLMERPMKSKEAYPVSEDTPPTNNGIPEEQTPARQDVDVLLDVPELEVDRISLTVRGLRAHVSILAELASLVNLQVGVDARLDEVNLEIEGVRAKVLLKVRLDEVRAILNHALNTLAEHPEILRALTRALNELVDGLVGSALGTLENVLGSLEVGDTVDELLKGRLEDARDTLKDLLDQAGAQAQEGVVGGSGGAQAGSLPPSAGEATPEDGR